MLQERRIRGVQCVERFEDAMTAHWKLVGNSEGKILEKNSMCIRIILKLASMER